MSLRGLPRPLPGGAAVLLRGVGWEGSAFEQSSLPLRAASADRTTVSSAPNPVPSPALPGFQPNPTGMQPVTCAAAAVDVPLPPRPKKTQRHLALTQLQKSQEKRRLQGRASAPKSRGGRARALTSRRERSKWSGKSLATSFGTAWAPQKQRRQPSPSSLLPLCLCHSLPPHRPRLWPHPLLQHEVIASQSPRARQKSSGADWLRTPPLPLPIPLTEHPRSCCRPTRRKPPFRGKAPPPKPDP